MADRLENSKPIVAVTRKLPTPVEARMTELFDARLNADDVSLSTAALCQAVASADVLACTVGDGVTRDVIDSAGPQLKLIANFGVGVNHIDLEAAAAKGILVSNTPDVLTEDTADLALALILMASRSLSSGERVLRAGRWDGWAPTSMMAGRVNGKKLGIIGMGRIGIAVARRAGGFNMDIHYNNRRPVDAAVAQELGATFWDDLDSMLAAVDVVSVNCPQTEDTFH
ncbi:MAG: NAD(P)-dependent oxidoreductase, partial [Proteobacteria bacterium]|nr:NAD(P)-dependent oxidoreductase [Pseudomonadota bacterium]